MTYIWPLPPLLDCEPCWRPATASDVPGIIIVGDHVHSSLPEGAEVFTERIKLFPEGCLVLTEGDKIYGYAISHPILWAHPPALDSLLGEMAPEADAYYIHDLAVMPQLHGQGFGAKGVSRLLEVAQRYESVCLISVYGTEKFWGKFGFVKASVNEILAEKIRGYGDDAVFLVRGVAVS